MPKLYEYFGLTVFFYSNDHLPVHVHGRREQRENKAELVVVDGEVIDIRLERVAGRQPLSAAELRDFQILVQNRAQSILQSWIAYFVENRIIKSETITRKIK